MFIRFVSADWAFVPFFLLYARHVKGGITVGAFNRCLNHFSTCLAYVIRAQYITFLIV
jgi:hypothetical protein